MLKITRKDSALSVETMGGILSWDAQCGGQISQLVLKDGLAAHPLLAPRQVLPNLEFTIDGRRVSLLQARAKLEVTATLPDYLKISAQAELLNGALRIDQEYELHEEGLLFCNFAVELASGKKIELGNCSFNPALDTAGCRHARWGYFTRQPKYKRDYSTIHAFATFSLFHPAGESCDERELLPYVSADLGWADTRFFSNHLELVLEDWTAFNDGPLTQTRTQIRGEPGALKLNWHFHDGPTVTINGPYRYRNRWGLNFARARTESGPGADPAVRNNALGARICHCMYPYARGGDRWPLISMPLKQIPEQPPQTFKGNPELARVDEAKRAGANLMILHQFWMRNPGSNNEPPADYLPFDPDWLRAFTNRCHELDLRVLYYGRGTEMWLEYSTFFEDFLKPDRDGLYIDWNGPFNMGYIKCSPLHVSLHNYFHFTKALRRRVGPGGLLVGHTASPTQVSSASFDANLGGEISVRHTELLSNPESAAYFGQLDCSGAHLISGNLPDRIAFSSARATALCAALGMASHPFMEPGVPFDQRVAFVKPLWDAQNSLAGNIVRLHNPAYSPTRAVSTENEHLFPSLWQADRGQALLLVTNMAETAQSGSVTLNLGELDVPKNASVRALAIDGIFPAARPAGNAVQLEKMPALGIAALLIG